MLVIRSESLGKLSPDGSSFREGGIKSIVRENVYVNEVFVMHIKDNIHILGDAPVDNFLNAIEPFRFDLIIGVEVHIP